MSKEGSGVGNTSNVIYAGYVCYHLSSLGLSRRRRKRSLGREIEEELRGNNLNAYCRYGFDVWTSPRESYIAPVGVGLHENEYGRIRNTVMVLMGYFMPFDGLDLAHVSRLFLYYNGPSIPDFVNAKLAVKSVLVLAG